MKLKSCFILVACISLMGSDDFPKVDGVKLTTVPGPLVDDSRMDPSRWPGSSKGLDFRRMARRSSTIPSVAAPMMESIIEDKVNDQAGWKAYRFDIPPNSSYEFGIKAERQSWFTLRVVNKWGQVEEGMTQNIIQRGYPYASYINKSNETRTIFVVLDTTEDHSFGEPYSLLINVMKKK